MTVKLKTKSKDEVIPSKSKMSKQTKNLSALSMDGTPQTFVQFSKVLPLAVSAGVTKRIKIRKVVASQRAPLLLLLSHLLQ